ncbi:MAG: hypothetical protein WDN69_27900 [Aliidongia sp.]
MFNTNALETNSFDPVTASTNYIPLSGGGPTGMVLDEARGRLYALTRFDDAVKGRKSFQPQGNPGAGDDQSRAGLGRRRAAPAL